MQLGTELKGAFGTGTNSTFSFLKKGAIMKKIEIIKYEIQKTINTRIGGITILKEDKKMYDVIILGAGPARDNS